MTPFPDWHPVLPANCTCPGWLGEQGSLTARLIATGHTFAVELQSLADVAPHPEEACCLGLSGDTRVLAREVRLTLDSIPVIFARSVSAGSGWRRVLDRGGQSLGYTLFGDDTGIQREPLEYALLTPDQPPHPGDVPPLFARRSVFVRHGERLLVQEVFLPALTRFLP